MAVNGKSVRTILDYGLEDISYVYHNLLPPSEEEVNVCKSWITSYAKRANKIKRADCIDSYSLKHIIERDTGEYVSNGACIKAAKDLGYRYWNDPSSVNAYFYMSLHCPENDWIDVRAKDFSKWLFEQTSYTLAQEAVLDPNWPRRSSSYWDYFEYLKSQSTSPRILEQFYQLWELYTGIMPPRPDLVNVDLVYDKECDILEFREKGVATYQDSEASKTYLYALVEIVKDSYDMEIIKVCYVGKTNSPSRRLREHVLYPGTLSKVKWIGRLLNEGKYPIMAIFDKVDKVHDTIYEKAAIYAFSQTEMPYDEEQKVDWKSILINEAY